jgi:hypothetical protein
MQAGRGRIYSLLAGKEIPWQGKVRSSCDVFLTASTEFRKSTNFRGGVVDNSKAKLIKFLESKRCHLEGMEKTLIEQAELIRKQKFDDFREKSEHLDHVIEIIKNIDYEIARIETDDLNLSGMINSGDSDVRKVIGGIIRVSRKNLGLMSELSDTLTETYRLVKEECGDNIEKGELRGYEGNSGAASVYYNNSS